MEKNTWTTPLAIVIAGVLIAGGIYFGSKAPDIDKTGDDFQASQEIRAIANTDHILGNPNAEIIVLEYGDLECPPCKLFHQTMTQVMEKYGKDGNVAWVYRHLPIVELHSKAPKEAEATECAFEQGGNEAFWNFANKIYDITPSNDGLDLAELPKIAKELSLDVSKFNACLSSGKYTEKVQDDYNDAMVATDGQPGTPHVKIIPADGVTNKIKTAVESVFGAGQFDFTDKYISIGGAMRFEGFDLLLTTIFDAK